MALPDHLRCRSTILIGDDRFPMLDRCDRPAGHGGFHESDRACEPKAVLTWLGSYATDDSDSTIPSPAADV